MRELVPKFVEFIPAVGESLAPGILYISMKHNTVVHRCPCECGGLSEFVLDPIRFQMEYDGMKVTFHPSIGNSNLECRSHYWIRENQVQWCAPMGEWESKQAERRELSRALEVRGAEERKWRTCLGELWKIFVGLWRK